MFNRKSVLALALASAPVIGIGVMSQVTSVSAANPTGTCVSASPFTADGTCTVLAGETVNFVAIGGDGGDGGDYVELELTAIGAQAVNPGGNGGRGRQVTGSYSNTTGATVTLTLEAGMHGVDGSDQTVGVGAMGVTTSGGDGSPSRILLNGQEIVSAGGGFGGLAATNSQSGADGGDGTARPNPLPSGWTSALPSGTPGISFSGTGVAPVTTTTATATTTVTEQEERTTALPETGSQSGQFILVALIVLGVGGVITALRRRVIAN